MANKKNSENDFGNFIIEKGRNGLYKKYEDGKSVRFCRRIIIKSIKKYIDKDIIKANILYDILGNEAREVILGREQYLNPNNLLLQQRNGMDVMPSNVKILAEHLREEEEKAVIENIHSTLGFGEYMGIPIYKLHKCIGIDSTYEGEFDVKPNGSKDEYINLIKNDVLGQASLEFVLLVTLSSVLISYLSDQIDIGSLIVHLVGNSTIGKSTIMKLAISMFANPSVRKNGLISTYNTTENALFKQIEGLQGVPFGIDELSASNMDNYSRLIYNFYSGIEKARMNKDSTLQERGSWSTVILSNGEKSLLKSSDKNAGISIRVIEVSNTVFTKDAENADKINEVIASNYGHIGFEFAEYVMNQGKENVLTRYNHKVNELKTFFSQSNVNDNFTDRRVKQFAMILLAGEFLENIMQIKLNEDGIKELILNIERESIKNRNLERSAMEYIKEYVSANQNKFEVTDKEYLINSQWWGRIVRKDENMKLEILPSKFKEILKDGGFEDDRVVLKELKKTKLLDYEKGRYTRTRKNSFGMDVNVYVIEIS
ncbi:DUF927 domain-containing protein [Clostridium butyricum]|uniref:DUF927 domain-containing protein n=1 Tax=Clostridium butyricum TaxID=1492 RepID=UPI003466D390